MRIRSKAFHARSCEEYYLKAEKEALKEESKSSHSGNSHHNNSNLHSQNKNSYQGRPRSESKSASDLSDETRKAKRNSPQLKELMTNYVMEAGAFDPFHFNEKEPKNKKSKQTEESHSKDKISDKVKSKKHGKAKNNSLANVIEIDNSQENGGEDFLEVRKRSSSISAIEAMNNGASLPNSLSSSSSSSPSSSDEGIGEDEQKNSDDDDNSNSNSEGEEEESSSSSNSSSSSDSSDDSSDNDDDDEEKIRIKESQQLQAKQNEVELYENEFFNSGNNWGRRKKLNLSQTSELFEENLYCNYENGSSSLSKQIKTNVMIVGESNIGKTELISEIFANNQFPSKLNANYSLDLMVHKLSKNEQEYKINLWIQNLSNLQYQWIIEQVYYKIVSTFIFLYNDSDAKSLESIKSTYSKTKAWAPDAKYILIGINTNTSAESKEIQDQAKAFTEENNFSYYFERIQSQSVEESQLTILKHYICPLLFDKDNDSFKCSDFQICQNSTQDSPKSIELSLNKNISQDYSFAKQVVAQQYPSISIQLEQEKSSNETKQQENKQGQIILFKEEITNGFSISENRRQNASQKRDFCFNEQDSTGNTIKFGGVGYYLDSEEGIQYSQPNKIFQQFPLVQENNTFFDNKYPETNDQTKSDQQNQEDKQIPFINETNESYNDYQELDIEQKSQQINDDLVSSQPPQNIQLQDQQAFADIPIKIPQQG